MWLVLAAVAALAVALALPHPAQRFPHPESRRVRGILLTGDQHVVLGLNAKEGVYGVPGGHLESDETDEEALARELREETGLTAMSYSAPRRITTVPDALHQMWYTVPLNDDVAVEDFNADNDPDNEFGAVNDAAAFKSFSIDALPPNLFPDARQMIRTLRRPVDLRVAEEEAGDGEGDEQSHNEEEDKAGNGNDGKHEDEDSKPNSDDGNSNGSNSNNNNNEHNKNHGQTDPNAADDDKNSNRNDNSEENDANSNNNNSNNNSNNNKGDAERKDSPHNDDDDDKTVDKSDNNNDRSAGDDGDKTDDGAAAAEVAEAEAEAADNVDDVDGQMAEEARQRRRQEDRLRFEGEEDNNNNENIESDDAAAAEAEDEAEDNVDDVDGQMAEEARQRRRQEDRLRFEGEDHNDNSDKDDNSNANSSSNKNNNNSNPNKNTNNNNNKARVEVDWNDNNDYFHNDRHRTRSVGGGFEEEEERDAESINDVDDSDKEENVPDNNNNNNDDNTPSAADVASGDVAEMFHILSGEEDNNGKHGRPARKTKVSLEEDDGKHSTHSGRRRTRSVGAVFEEEAGSSGDSTDNDPADSTPPEKKNINNDGDNDNTPSAADHVASGDVAEMVHILSGEENNNGKHGRPTGKTKGSLEEDDGKHRRPVRNKRTKAIFHVMHGFRPPVPQPIHHHQPTKANVRPSSESASSLAGLPSTSITPGVYDEPGQPCRFYSTCLHCLQMGNRKGVVGSHSCGWCQDTNTCHDNVHRYACPSHRLSNNMCHGRHLDVDDYADDDDLLVLEETPPKPPLQRAASHPTLGTTAMPKCGYFHHMTNDLLVETRTERLRTTASTPLFIMTCPATDRTRACGDQYFQFETNAIYDDGKKLGRAKQYEFMRIQTCRWGDVDCGRMQLPPGTFVRGVIAGREEDGVVLKKMSSTDMLLVKLCGPKFHRPPAA